MYSNHTTFLRHEYSGIWKLGALSLLSGLLQWFWSSSKSSSKEFAILQQKVMNQINIRRLNIVKRFKTLKYIYLSEEEEINESKAYFIKEFQQSIYVWEHHKRK